MPQAQKSSQWNQPAPIIGQRPHTLAVRAKIGPSSKLIKRFKLGDFKFEIRKSLDALWIIARAKTGGGIALRAVYSADGELEITKDTTARFGFRLSHGWKHDGRLCRDTQNVRSERPDDSRHGHADTSRATAYAAATVECVPDRR